MFCIVDLISNTLTFDFNVTSITIICNTATVQIFGNKLYSEYTNCIIDY